MVQPTAAPVSRVSFVLAIRRSDPFLSQVAKASAGSRYETSAVAVLSAVAAFVMNW